MIHQNYVVEIQSLNRNIKELQSDKERQILNLSKKVEKLDSSNSKYQKLATEYKEKYFFT